jgi:DNA topoisomerase-1
VRAVLDALDAALGPHFFPPREDGEDPRSCPACADGRIGLRLGRHGPFVGCSNYPDCKFTRRFGAPADEEAGDADLAAGPKLLGIDPDTGKEVTLPKRTSVPKGFVASEIDLATALALLALPRDIGPHPDDGEIVQTGIGRYGPYVKHGATYASLPEPRDVLTIGLNHAVTLIAEKGKGTRRGSASPIREIGRHPEDDKPISVYAGRYGPYVKHGKVNATIPKERDPAELTLDEAVALISARATRSGRKTAAARKTATKSPVQKAARKPARNAAATKKGKRAAAADAVSD